MLGAHSQDPREQFVSRVKTKMSALQMQVTTYTTICNQLVNWVDSDANSTHVAE